MCVYLYSLYTHIQTIPTPPTLVPIALFIRINMSWVPMNTQYRNTEACSVVGSPNFRIELEARDRLESIRLLRKNGSRLSTPVSPTHSMYSIIIKDEDGKSKAHGSDGSRCTMRTKTRLNLRLCSDTRRVDSRIHIGSVHRAASRLRPTRCPRNNNCCRCGHWLSEVITWQGQLRQDSSVNMWRVLSALSTRSGSSLSAVPCYKHYMAAMIAFFVLTLLTFAPLHCHC